jgi:hypothetical protein
MMIGLAYTKLFRRKKLREEKEGKGKNKADDRLPYNDGMHRIRNRIEQKTDVIGTVITRPTETHIR